MLGVKGHQTKQKRNKDDNDDEDADDDDADGADDDAEVYGRKNSYVQLRTQST